jgi:hypothetical protein
MASAILRFKNPYIYQIMDQKVYRIVYWEKMPRFTKSKNSNEKSISSYFDYLDELHKICKNRKYKIDFHESDRVLYALDDEVNKGIKIDY